MKYDKHYSASYLTDTGEFLKRIKKDSYLPFSALKDGVILDLGCGTGMDVVNLANILGDGVSVVGIDHDPQLIAQAKNSASDKVNISFVHQEIYPLDYAENEISGVRLERVVQHLVDPICVFEEIYRVLRENHPLVVVETIWNDVNFYTSHVDTEYKIRQYLTQRKVNYGLAGNKLTSDLAASGFRGIRLESYGMVVHTKEEADRYLYIDKILTEMVEVGAMSVTEANTFNKELTVADKGGYFTCSINLVIVRATK